MMKMFAAVRSTEDQTEDRYLARFMCYLIYDLALVVLFALVALTDDLTAVVSAMYCVDAACLFWLTSCVKTKATFPVLRRITYLNLATNTATLLVYLAIRLRYLLVSSGEGVGLGRFKWIRMPFIVLGFAFIAGSKVVKLLAIDSFRTWLGIHHPSARQGFLVSAPGARPQALAPVTEAGAGAAESTLPKTGLTVKQVV